MIDANKGGVKFRSCNMEDLNDRLKWGRRWGKRGLGLLCGRGLRLMGEGEG